MENALYAYLYYTSVFKDMESDFIFNVTGIIRWLCMQITVFLASILDGAEYLIRSCWQFLQFSNFGSEKYKDATTSGSAELYNLFTNYLWIPLLIAIIVLAAKLFLSNRGNDDLKRFATNLVMLIMVVMILPSALTVVNDKIFNMNSKILSVDSNTISSTIFYRHTTDYWYVYKKYVNDLVEAAKNNDSADFDAFCLDNKDKIGALTDMNTAKNFSFTNKNKYIKAKFPPKVMRRISLSDIDINQVIDDSFVTSIDDNDDSFTELPEFFKVRINSYLKYLFDTNITGNKNIKTSNVKSEVRDELTKYLNKGVSDGLTIGTNTVIGLINERYYRYRTDFLCVYLELISNIFLFFAASYALLKIAWELMINRVFLGVLAAIDLNGGEKIKKALNAILGLYISAMFIGLTLTLYNSALTFVGTTLKVSNLAYSIIALMLASIALDGPNVIARYFGVETGMRGGGDMLKRTFGHTTNAVRQAAMMHRMHRMYKNNHGARNQNGEKENIFQRGLSGFRNARDEKAENDRVLGNAKDEKSPFSNKGFDKADDYKNELMNNNPNMNDKDAEQAANQYMADDNKGQLYKDALLGQMKDAKADGKPADDNEALTNAMRNSDKDFSKNNNVLSSVADNLSADGKYSDYKDKIYSDIADRARNYKGTNNASYASNPMNAYKDAARNFAGQEASNAQVSNLANMAYADAHRDNIRRQAKIYQAKSKDAGTKVSDRDAIAHVISNNTNGCATGMDKSYATSVAENMINHGSLSAGDVRVQRNQGADKFK